MNKFTTYESLETGKLREEVGQLEGRAYKSSAPCADKLLLPKKERKWNGWYVRLKVVLSS